MSQLRLDDSRDGLRSFPTEFTVVARDDMGDVLAVDAHGAVRCFAHGTGDWKSHTLAFADVAMLHEHLAFQEHFEPPPHDADLAMLRARKSAIQQFMKGRRRAPYSRLAADGALEDLRDAIADKRWRSSKKGQGLLACQAIGLECDKALRDAGAGEDWMCRAAAEDGSVLGVQGNFVAPWTIDRVTELLTPLVGKRTLKLVQWPRQPQ